jgi:hypothetical protein
VGCGWTAWFVGHVSGRWSTRFVFCASALLHREPGPIHLDPSNPTTSFGTGPDVNDPPYTPAGANPELYNVDGVAYDSLIVGLFNWFYSDQSLVEL